MRHIRPVWVVHEPGVSEIQMQAVVEGIDEMLQLAGVANLIEVKNFGDWRHETFEENGKLIPYMSVEWYIQKGISDSSRGDQINASSITGCLMMEPWRDDPHFDVFILRSDMYSGKENNNFVVGLALPTIGTVVSIFRFLDLEIDPQFECIKTETMHEFGHVLGLLPKNRTLNTERSLGKHCTNICIMRQGLTLPDDWVEITQDRISSGQALCDQCLRDLQNFFI